VTGNGKILGPLRPWERKRKGPRIFEGLLLYRFIGIHDGCGVGTIWLRRGASGFVCLYGGFEVRIVFRDVDEVEVSGGHLDSPVGYKALLVCNVMKCRL
jgi:hypothetical protein